MTLSHLGILGGTFDPIHAGHLRTALELAEELAMARMCLLPSGIPPHRGAPVASPQQRLAMAELAIAGDDTLAVDGRESRKTTTAYTIDTLRELRAEVGEQTAISFCVGADAFMGMPAWRDWQEFPRLCHIVVVARPGWHLPADLGALECWRDRFIYQGDTLARSCAGKVLFVSLTPMDVSASRIRDITAAGFSARYLLPDSVWHYIQQHRLYRGGTR